MAVVLRRLGINPLLTTLGAYIFAFSLPRQAQLPNFLNLPQALTPFALYYFWTFTREPSRRRWLRLLLCTAGQILCSLQLGH